MKTIIAGLMSALLALVGYNIYEWINKRWFKRKDFIKVAKDFKFSDEVSSFLWDKSKGKIQQMVSHNKKGEEKLAAGFVIIKLNEEKITEIRSGLSADYLTFIYDFDKNSKSLGIIKSYDKFSILKTVQTHSDHNNVSNGRLINDLKALDKKTPFTISGAGADWVELSFPALPEDVPFVISKAAELIPFAEGSPELTTLKEEFNSTHKLFLWWPTPSETEQSLT